MYALAKRDRVEFQLGFTDDDFGEPQPGEFDRASMTTPFEYTREKVRAGYPWRTAPPGF
jgi:hypothetical protein